LPEAPAERRDGRALFEAVQALLTDRSEVPVRLNGIDCMSGCNHPCTIALACPGKPTLLFGGLVPGPGHAAQVLELAGLYQRSETGIVPAAELPPAFRGGMPERGISRP
jgi:predicted metal-binding protein